MFEPVVVVKDANIYQGGNLILSDVNFTVERGEFVYLVGKTGTGKSSLLKTLYGELHLKEGDASVAGYDLRKMDWKKVPFLRRNLGVVFQDFQLLTDRNVNENLRFVLKATGWKEDKLIDEKINDVLDKVGLKSKGFKMTYELSGGEQQRVNIARGFITSHAVLLLDEPTASLDAANRAVVTEMIREKKRAGVALLGIFHDAAVRGEVADRIIDVGGFAPDRKAA